jgi:hypothetical protein
MTTALLPLEVLEKKLTACCPPSLDFLLCLFQDTEQIKKFHDLVKEYLPEHENEIMRKPAERTQKFTSYFSAKYFPLADVSDWEGSDDPERFVWMIPINRMGFEMEDWDDMSRFGDAQTLLLSLVAYPYSDGDGERVPIIERAAEIVGKTLAGKIPPLGWKPETLHKALDRTKYETAAVNASYVWQDSDCQICNVAYDNECEDPEWDRELVDTLSQEWKEHGQLMFDKINAFQNWLEGDLRRNFAELLNFIIKSKAKPEVPPKEKAHESLTLMQIFSEESTEEDDNERILDAHRGDL